MRVGVIGTGNMGMHHVRVYSETGIELVGISDININRANEIAHKYKTKVYPDYKELLDQELDAVSIAVPTTLHKKVALDAINSGTHALIEKPIADTLENADAIIKASKKKGVKVMVGQIERFNPAVMKLKEMIGSGKLGKVVSAYALRAGPYDPRIKDVGIIMDLGVHDIDAISYLYGKNVRSVFAIAGKKRHAYEEFASITLRYDDSAGVINTNWLTPKKIRTLTIVGLDRVAYLDYIKQEIELHDENCIQEIQVDRCEPLKNEINYFIKKIEQGEEVISNAEEARHALEVAIAAIESYKKGEAVKISKKRKANEFCKDCRKNLLGENRYVVYSPRLKPIGYRCDDCHEKNKLLNLKEHEDKMSKMVKEVNERKPRLSSTSYIRYHRHSFEGL